MAIVYYHKTILTMLFLSAALFAGAADEVKLPLQMANLETTFKRNCPEHITIASQKDELVITVGESERKSGFERTQGINLKRLAGRTFTFVIDVKLDNFAQEGLPSNVGQIHFGDSRQLISTKHGDWHTYLFKGVKIPGNGLLKMRISVKNVPGEIRIRNPRIRGNFPKVRDNNAKKKKKKKNKD